MDKIKMVEHFVEERSKSSDNYFGLQSYTHHIKTVALLAEKYHLLYNADKETTVISAYLHDIASIYDKDYEPIHHIIGVGLAFDILTSILKLDISDSKLMLIQKCIYNHRGSIVHEKLTPEERCVADCDAMAHMFEIPSLFSLAYRIRKMNAEEGIFYVRNKLENDYKKLSTIGKEIVKEQYSATKLLLVNEDDKYTCGQEQNLSIPIFNVGKMLKQELDKSYDISIDDAAVNTFKDINNIFNSLNEQQASTSEQYKAAQKILTRRY